MMAIPAYRIYRNISIIIPCTIIFYSCATATLLQKPVKIDQSKRAPVSETTAAISRFNFYSQNNPLFHWNKNSYLLTLKESFKNSIYNTGLYKQVTDLTSSDSNDKTPSKIKFDIDIKAEEIGDFNWWVTWPAAYPMPFYWPIQSKSGHVNVNLRAEIYKENKLLETVTLLKSKPYSITFFGFFRTANIEDAAHDAYFELIQDFTLQLTTKRYDLMIPPQDNLAIRHLALLEFENSDLSKKEMKVFQDRLSADLLAVRKFQLIDRESIKEVLKEQAFQQTGCTSDLCVVKMGRILGATHIANGRITKINNKFFISMKITDVESGKIIRLVDDSVAADFEELIRSGVSNITKKLNF